MEFRDVIERNAQLNIPVHWWTRYAFHYTDIYNAVSILASGQLYSRTEATELHVMGNDNASRQVIDMTGSDITSKARFYFRPLTPTQYHNEGYKHPALRYNKGECANMPVPIFLVFDLEKLLSLPGVEFSEKSLAGHGDRLFSGAEAFEKLNFERIYSNGPMQDPATDTKYRHAEIVHPSPFRIDSCLKYILCRNMLERTTLLNMLKRRKPQAFALYQDIVKCPKREVFQQNGLYLQSCTIHENVAEIAFSYTGEAAKYTAAMMHKYNVEQLSPIPARICVQWFSGDSLVHVASASFDVEFEDPQDKTFTLPPIAADRVSICVFFDGHQMCLVDQPLHNVTPPF